MLINLHSLPPFFLYLLIIVRIYISMFSFVPAFWGVISGSHQNLRMLLQAALCVVWGDALRPSWLVASRPFSRKGISEFESELARDSLISGESRVCRCREKKRRFATFSIGPILPRFHLEFAKNDIWVGRGEGREMGVAI